MRAHPVLIRLCLISLSKTPFPLPAGSNWSLLTLSKHSHLFGKQFFLSWWIHLELSINLTDAVSCTKLPKSGMLLRMKCFIRLHLNLAVIRLGISRLMEIHRPHHPYSTIGPVCLNIWRQLFWQTTSIFAPKRIRGLSSVDSKQSIIEIGCHCYDANCPRCHLVPNREGKTLFFPHFTFCVCGFKQRRKRKLM